MERVCAMPRRRTHRLHVRPMSRKIAEVPLTYQGRHHSAHVCFSLCPCQTSLIFHNCVEGDGADDQEDGVEGGEDG